MTVLICFIVGVILGVIVNSVLSSDDPFATFLAIIFTPFYYFIYGVVWLIDKVFLTVMRLFEIFHLR